MMQFSSLLIGAIPLLEPLHLPFNRLWMFPPLVLCVALVYRATRARRVEELLLPTLRTFFNIMLGMVALAVAFYFIHMAAVRLF